ESMLERLSHAVDDLDRVQRALSRTAAQLGELGQDLCDDAVLRLKERQAAPPQIESYIEGWELRRQQLLDGVADLREVKRTLEATLEHVRGFNGFGSDSPN